MNSENYWRDKAISSVDLAACIVVSAALAAGILFM